MAFHAAFLVTSALLSLGRPALEHGLCPIATNPSTKHLCETTVEAMGTLSTVIGTGYGLYTTTTYATDLSKSFLSNLQKFILPAGLGMVAANTLLNADHLPAIGFFIVGTLKSTLEMTVARKISSLFLGEESLSPLLSLRHPVFAGGVAAINVAQSTNTLFYAIKTTLDPSNNASFYQNAKRGQDYALAYLVARMSYQVGSVVQDKKLLDKPLLGAGLYFFAPIARGMTLSLSATGSVTVPGHGIDYFSNILDGVALATTSLGITYLGNELESKNSPIAKMAPFLKKLGAGNLFSALFLGGVVAYRHLSQNTPLPLAHSDL